MSFSYARGEISSFVVEPSWPYIRCMKNRDFNILGADELYALERAARRERSRQMAKLAHRAYEFLRHAFEGKGQKGLRHA